MGNVIAITGASSGIGREAARLLVEAGAKVALGARRLDRLNALVEELGSDNALAVEMDVTVPQDNNGFIAQTLAKFGRLDSVVANAGLGHYGGISDNSDADMANMINVNFTGTVWTVRAAVPQLRKAGGGDVVIVASVAGLRGDANEAVYAGTKFAQVGMAGAMDRELSPEGIRVTCHLPCWRKHGIRHRCRPHGRRSRTGIILASSRRRIPDRHCSPAAPQTAYGTLDDLAHAVPKLTEWVLSGPRRRAT